MNYETFKSSAVTSIQNYFGEKTSVSLHPVMKNNNILLDGLFIQDQSLNITPAIYLNHYYEDYLSGKPFSSVLDDIVIAYQNNLPVENMDFSFFTDYDKIKYQIIYKLINYNQNQKILEDVPHYRFLDLAIVFCCYLPDMPDGNATILIHNHHLGIWKISADLLYELAIKNTPILLPYEITGMEDALKKICPEFCLPDSESDGLTETPSMYVLTNTEKLYGASAMLYPDVISYFADSVNCDLYILPSSIHEVLLLPKKSDSDIIALNLIIQDVNASQVPKEEILSDHAYIFERAAGFIAL